MIAAAFLLGFLGSLHCVGMCGPIIIMVNGNGDVGNRMVYHLGRISTYLVLGLAMAAIGESIKWFGFQQWVSIVLGVIILLGLLFYKNPERALFEKTGLSKITSLLRKGYASLTNERSYSKQFVLGMLNGILPCGLVYAALAMVLTVDGFKQASLLILAFGVGTLPALLLVEELQKKIKINMKALFTWSMAFVACLLIIRGLNLDIPYISPKVSSTGQVQSCH